VIVRNFTIPSVQYLALVASDLVHSSLLSTNAWPRSFDKKVSGFVICEERDGEGVWGLCVWGVSLEEGAGGQGEGRCGEGWHP